MNDVIFNFYVDKNDHSFVFKGKKPLHISTTKQEAP